MTFAEKLILARKRLGLSQEALAEALGVSRQAVSKWETGEALPETGKLPALAKLLGVSIDELLSEEPAEAQTQRTPQSGAAPDWIDQLPRLLGRFVRRWGWLYGVYVALGGLGILILGVIAKIISGQMVRSYAQSMAPWGFAQQGGFTVESGSLDGLFGPPQVFNPVGAVATVMIVLGALGMVIGVVLALWLKRKQGK